MNKNSTTLTNSFLFLLIFIFCSDLNGQNALKITGGHIKVTGDVGIVLKDCQLQNDGTLTATNGTVEMKGTGTTAQSEIGGTGTTTFHNLKINKTTNNAQLGTSITVNNQMEMVSGNLDIQSHMLTLGTTNGTLVGESETAYITSSSTGILSKTLDLNAPSSINPGNLGVEISSAANLGVTKIDRGHDRQTLASGESVLRHFTITPTNNTDLAASLTFHYLTPELNGIDEEELIIVEKITDWTNGGVSSRDASNNKVTNSDYLALYQYTLGTCADISLDAPIVAAVNYCEGSTAVALTAMGENLQWYEASTGGTTIATPTPNTDVVGTTSYWVSQTVEGCESARSQITVTVNAIPNAPSVANVSYCVGETASALTATGSNLAWYDTSSGGTSISTPTPNTAAAGTTNYWVSQTVEGCESSRAQITVTINAIPNAPTVTNVSYCVGETASTLTATGSNLTWYDVSSGGTSIGTPTPNTAAAGTTDYWVSQTVSGCESSRSQITVTINAIPDAPLVTNVNYCVGETASALMATGSNLIWYDMSSGGTSISTPTPNTAAAGTTNYWVSQTVEGCESSRSQITVTINAIPDAPSVTNVSYCVGETASALTAMGSNLTWYDVSNGGTSISTPTPSTDAAGTTNYWVSQTVNSCEGSRSQITVTVNAIPDAPSVTNVSYCVGETASVLTATGSNLTWYDMSSGGTSISTPTPNTNAAGTTNYWVSQTVEGCESSRSQITVTVNAIPDAPSVTNVSYCVGETASALTATGSNLTWYDMSSGGTSISTPTPNTAAAGTTNYWVSQTVDGCESTRSQITVTVNAIPDMPSVSNISYCVGETASALTATGSNLIWYDMSSGGTSINTPTPSTDAAGTTNYWVSQTVDGCESIRSQITVTVNAIPDAPSVTNVSYCVGETASALTATGSNLTWYDASSGGTAIDAPTPNTSTVGATSYWVSQMVSGCESKRAKTEVIVREINNTVMDFVLVATEDIEALDLTHLLFYADADLESDAQITEAATKDVSFHAGQQITLTAGFTVSAGNTFTAKIGAPCKDESAITENRIATSRTTQSKTAFDLFDCQVYPNPTQNWAHIKITQSRTRQVQLSLFDANGRLLQTLLQEASLASGQHTYQLDLQNVEEGIYWLRLMGDREIITKKVVVLRQ